MTAELDTKHLAETTSSLLRELDQLVSTWGASTPNHVHGAQAVLSELHAVFQHVPRPLGSSLLEARDDPGYYEQLTRSVATTQKLLLELSGIV